MSSVAGSPVVHAEPVDMAPQHYGKQTRDGWTLTIDTDEERVNSVPNLADATNSREAFVTLSATATASGGSTAITDSALIIGYQLGCQSDVSAGLLVGGTLAVGPQLAVGVPLMNPAGASVNAGVSGGAIGSLQTVVAPSVIVDVPMSNMALMARRCSTSTTSTLKVDACGGDVTTRSYAYLQITTGDARTQLATYGDPIKI